MYTLQNPVCPLNTSPCGRSQRRRVCRHHANMCFNMCAWCWYTRGRFERTHGDVLSGHTEKGGNHRQFCLPKFAHIGLSRASKVHLRNSWILHILSLRIGREQHVPDSCNHSLCLIKLFNSTSTEGHCSGNQLLRWFGLSFAPFSKKIERFARQYRCSTRVFSGTVHHPSGPDTYAPLSTFKTTGGCRCTCPSIHFHCACSKQNEKHQHTHTDAHNARRQTQRKRRDRKRRSTSQAWEHVPSMMCTFPSL